MAKPLLELELELELEDDDELLEELEEELLDEELEDELNEELLELLDDELLEEAPSPVCPPHALRKMAKAAAPKNFIIFIRWYPMDFYCSEQGSAAGELAIAEGTVLLMLLMQCNKATEVRIVAEGRRFFCGRPYWVWPGHFGLIETNSICKIKRFSAVL